MCLDLDAKVGVVTRPAQQTQELLEKCGHEFALYPSRSTVAGSSRAARHAGTQAASTPTTASTAAVLENVSGSRASTRKSRGAMKRAAHQLPARPTDRPATMS